MSAEEEIAAYEAMIQADQFKKKTNMPKQTAEVLEFQKSRKTQNSGAGGDNDPGLPAAFSEEALALRFAEKNRDHLRFVAAWGKWLIYDGKHWMADDTLRAFDIARQECREAARECNGKAQTILATAKTVNAVVTLARADRKLAATIEQWDADPMVLNTPGGVVDLATGDMRPHRPEDYLSKITAVAPGGACPKWRAFLHRVTDGDDALIAFLQRVFGYALTGLTIEHALIFLYGTGANGKSVFVNTISGIHRDYHAAIETFTASNVDRHPTDLAGLRGARLVTAVETEEGRRWAESKIKSLTGGDKIAARFMRQDYFEFTPQFKLLIAGNHKPGLRSVDEAIRRRFHLVPFTVAIPPDERDETLTERLKQEWPGILSWAIEGCLSWQEIGLRPPDAVLKATAKYLEAEDALAAWIEDATLRDNPDAWTQSSGLFASWTGWATRAVEHVGTMKRFAQNLEARGLAPERRSHGRGYLGIELKENDWQNRL